MILGNDISRHQGDVDFNVYKNNSNFLIIKVTEGIGYIDPKFIRNQMETRRVELPLGYYHFARPDLNVDPRVEADFFIKTLGEVRDGEILVLDYEPNWNGDHVGWCVGWLNRIAEKMNGLKCLVYLNQSQVTDFNWTPVVNLGCELWIAAYTGSPKRNNFVTGAWKYAVMQQWTSVQNVPGISSANVDGNVFFGTVETFKKYGFKKPQPVITPQEQTIVDLKRELQDVKNTLSSVNNAHTIALANQKANCQKKHDEIIITLRDLITKLQ